MEYKKDILDVIDAAYNDKPVNVQQSFESIMMQKLQDAVAAKREEVGRKINEVAEPKGEDEKRFKDKHIVDKEDHPVADEEQFKGKGPSKKKRLADMDEKDSEETYE